MSKCDHDLAVRQDANSSKHELLFCTKCDMEPKRRVSAAASLLETTQAQMAEMRDRLDSMESKLAALEQEAAIDRSEILGLLDTATKAAEAMNARLAKLEAFGGAG